MRNLALRRKRKLSPFRRIALGTWKTARDPSVRGALTLRADDALRYVEAYRAATGVRLTMTHVVAKAAAAALEAVPAANAVLRWGQIYEREEIALCFQVAMRDETSGEVDLTASTIRRPNEKGIGAIARELEDKFGRARADVDADLSRTRGAFRHLPLPGPAVGAALRAVSFASYTLNLDLSALGVPRDAFGSALVTNIGSLGLAEAYPPLVPYTRAPIVVAVGAAEDAPVVAEGGEVAAGKVLKVTATFDHRVLDGAHAAALVSVLRAWIERPFDHLEPIPAGAAPTSGTR